MFLAFFFFPSVHPPTWVRRIVLLVSYFFTLDGVGENGRNERNCAPALCYPSTTYSLIADVSQQHCRIE